MAAIIAATMPTSATPVTEVTAKPVTAPISIMPSTPRLRTPLFSTTSSPSAARSSGVAAPTMVMKTEM